LVVVPWLPPTECKIIQPRLSTTVSALSGWTVLVVEVENLLTINLQHELVDAGAVVVGPAASLTTALHLIRTPNELDIFTPAAGAVAFEEMRLQGKRVPDIDPSIRDEIFDRNGYEFITRDW
jgi:hypothetical protein